MKSHVIRGLTLWSHLCTGPVRDTGMLVIGSLLLYGNLSLQVITRSTIGSASHNTSILYNTHYITRWIGHHKCISSHMLLIHVGDTILSEFWQSEHTDHNMGYGRNGP